MYDNVKLNTARKKDTSYIQKQPKHTPTRLMKSSDPAVIIQRLRRFPQSFTKADAMVLQRTIGNKAVCKLMGEIGLFNNSPASIQQEALPEKLTQMKKEKNKTGLSDNLKAGVEKLSGLSMDDVRVHYNSGKPERLGALAYTQGTDIYVSPGQEKHIPHEVWHVVQQVQGRVKPTIHMYGAAVNDDAGLEREASEMGKKACKETIPREKGKTNDHIWLSHNPIIQGQWLNFGIGQFPDIKTMENRGENQVTSFPQKNTVQSQNVLRIHTKFLGDPRVRDFISRTCKHKPVINERKEPIQMVVLASFYGAPVQSWAILQAPLAPGPLGAPNPPGWVGNAHPNHHQRSHLIGGQFGAPKTLNNLVTLTDGSNHPGMSVHENILAAAIANNPAHLFLYHVTTDNTVFAATNSVGIPTVATPAPQGVIMDAVNLTTGIPVLQAVYVPNNIFQNHAGCVD
ncbi:eCIS core domain-containing protein [Ruminiclostridium cellulolyticum]|uniref:Uncharacterized protein n=1 Tax=Ruminiclostridium cellulolyticum (strain ATCC 35319 / DSM 5812 / JCM 6584 / H10) TaxID=394503 RepID=B8I3I0_RUMCH|nr:DNA/RNA non-specific endonuclease [Ruminiclostridium cellulolyticum]ACL76323.1 hypothetical protein Ccel_1975 [Ruminiclostridium cellulolyticum H10]